jgi:hypothetical protein
VIGEYPNREVTVEIEGKKADTFREEDRQRQRQRHRHRADREQFAQLSCFFVSAVLCAGLLAVAAVFFLSDVCGSGGCWHFGNKY